MSVATVSGSDMVRCGSVFETEVVIICRISAAITFILLVVAGTLSAQDASREQCGKEPTAAAQPAHAVASYKTLRQDEDWSCLRDPALQIDVFYKPKYIPLRNEDGWYVSLGGDVRERYELLDHPSWGQGPTDTNGYLMQRYLLHADIHLGPSVRFFSQIQSGMVNWRIAGPRPTDEDKLDIHQAFVDLGMGGEGRTALTFRVGRQELSFGTSRLVSIREEPNIRQAFDGFRASLTLRGWRIDGWATKPAETNPGVFDDSPDHTRTFWGGYAVRPWKVLPGGYIDIYYMGIARRTGRFDQGSARETRHSVGTRLWGGKAGWDYNYEMVFQWGAFGHGNIRAWTVASDNGYTLRHARFEPRLDLKADMTSGDRDPSNQNLQTFNAMFPKGIYFGEITLIGPANLIDLQPSVDFKPAKKHTCPN